MNPETGIASADHVGLDQTVKGLGSLFLGGGSLLLLLGGAARGFGTSVRRQVYQERCP